MEATPTMNRSASVATTLDVIERQIIVRLVVKEILIGDDSIVFRHCIPIGLSSPPDGGSRTSGSGRQVPNGGNYLLRSGSSQPNFIKRFSALCVRFVDDADIPGPSVVSVC
jgi:site-specific DNA recombinase